MRKLFMALGAGALVVGGIIGLAAVTASADTPSTGTLGPFTVVGGADGHSDGTATIVGNPTAGTYTITLTPNSGLSFTSGFVCVGDNGSGNPGTSYFTVGTGFTARVNPGGDSNGCPPKGSAASSFLAQSFTGGGPWVVSGVPASFFSDGSYLQVHISVSNGDTGFPCAVLTSSPFYGNCTDPAGGSDLPVGALGGLGAAVIVGAGLVVVQRRRERTLRSGTVRS